MTPKEALLNLVTLMRDEYKFPFNLTTEYKSLKQALNELEGLKKFKETFDNYELAKKRDFIAYENWLECEAELNRFPTVDEVIKAIQDDVHDEVNYKQEMFYNLNGCTYLSTQNKIKTNQALSPKTLILIGRFYEGLEK